MFKFDMLPSLYMGNDDALGGDEKPPVEVDLSKVDWAKVDPKLIPADFIKKTSAYTEVLDESITRRQAIKDLKTQLSKLSPDEPEKPETKPLTQTAANTQDVAGANTEIMKMLTEIQTRLNKSDTENLSSWQDQAAKDAGLKGERVIRSLKGSNAAEVRADAVALAKDLGIAPPSNSGSLGNPALERDKSLMERIKGNMMNNGSNNPFDAALQKSIGGRAVIDN